MLRLGVFSDLHLRVQGGRSAAWHGPFDFDGVPERVRLALAHFAAHRVDAVVALGDLAHDGDDTSLDAALGLLAEAGVPTFAVPGNHDGDRDHFAVAAERAVITQPGGAGVALDGGRLHAVTLEGDEAGGFRAGLPVVDADPSPLVIASHFPVLSQDMAPLAASGLAFPPDLDNRAELAAALAGMGRPVVVLSGHLHVHASLADGALLQLLVPAVIEAPMQAAVIDIDPRGPAVTRTAVALTGDGGLQRGPVFGAAVERWRFADDGWQLAASVSGAAA
jgi:hypothetical protein